MEGYLVKEISTILKIPQGTVKTRLAIGRRELKKQLSEEGFAIC
jgi:DNA-directed RNA polymerase specialized sigma24 family protein